MNTNLGGIVMRRVQFRLQYCHSIFFVGSIFLKFLFTYDESMYIILIHIELV